MSIDIEQFHSVFFEESEEHLDDMEQLLMGLNVDAPDPEELNSIFRAAHSIKGGSGIFGFDALMNLTHVMENLLDKARNGELSVTTEIVNVLLETLDVLKATLTAYRQQSPVPEDDIAQRITVLNAAIDGQEQSGASGDKSPHTTAEDDDGFGFFDDDDTVQNPSAVVSETSDDSFGFFDEEDVQPQSKSSAHEDDGFGFFDDAELPVNAENKVPSIAPKDESAAESNTPKPLSNKPTPTAPKSTSEANQQAKPVASRETVSIRVDTTKIDAMVNLVGELVITQSMLSMIGHEVDGQIGERLQLAIDELQRNTREIQESVMSMRMLPLTATFNRFPRLVRDLASKLDKKVELVLQGGNTEIDKSLIEKLVDPLTHLVRNSIDHGIESPSARRSNGKSETGTVILSAEQKGGSIIISIIDDGGGLHREKILDKARSNGLSVSDDMPDSAVWQLIFQPGFSTADAITDVSGRGVGMDVVRRNIESIGGRIEIESNAGEGSAFFIHLPLTLAIVDGMCVSVGEQIFVIPLLNIVESFQPQKHQLKTLGNDTVLYVRDQYWPLVPLYDFMDVDGAQKSATEGIVVLLESSKKRFGILVDALVGQQQVVIKSLELHYRKVAGIAGATIMGDGKVALIIDADSIATTYTSSQLEELLS
ncbi:MULTISPECIES: chemotaxis protein CheA [unclassified Alteromonas]|uniref:chemotaxis protein CheA n=1 Tax=unclassified Alteromonas TaxID=2614992 RepID=UPI001920755E|nr:MULTISPECIES: chemotaxis protein CheW [unclassified Alteromonas]WDT86422.1 chemotaxis protein CheW [Alteromonas sp. 009811495]BCO17403.1 chemotaxis protein CheA [Alteromonas sp. KC3]BCO21393.1 chemotaxis protein CheA [Alteromonas sp. KC14]